MEEAGGVCGMQLRAGRWAGARDRAWLLHTSTLIAAGENVLLKEEDGEEDEVREVHHQAKLPVRGVHVARRLLSKIQLDVRHARQTNDASDHLQDLDGRNEGSEGLHDCVEADVRHEEIEIHDGMHHKIHGGEPDARAGRRVQGMPAVQQDRHVVEPMQEDDLLFPKDEEDRVQELRYLAVDEERHPHANRPVRVPQLGIIANSVPETMVLQGGVQVRNDPRRADDRED
mmetsp:Transcript_3582/g.9182  ORF Transcript_3582/g.9182 Transcript_3582/m.9182 type:complete len:229 (+) Transcript_3582:225-911(+)